MFTYIYILYECEGKRIGACRAPLYQSDTLTQCPVFCVWKGEQETCGQDWRQ